jgi:hypothetical protein
MHVVVWSLTMRQIFKNRRRTSPWWNALLITILFVSGSLCIFVELYSGQRTWINYRNFPGGPLGFLLHSEDAVAPYKKAGPAASTITVLVGDALLV